MRTAAIRLDASARPVPAMSKAVPWSGLVRTKGRPSVTLTPCSTPRYFTGISPWSCVIATTMSNSSGLALGWPAAAGANGLLVERRGAEAARAPPNSHGAGVLEEGGGGAPRARGTPPQGLVGEARRQARRLPHRDAVRRHRRQVIGTFDPRD